MQISKQNFNAEPAAYDYYFTHYDDITRHVQPGKQRRRRHRDALVFDCINKLYNLKNNRCLTDGRKSEFWNFIVRALHANREQDFYYAMKDIDLEVFYRTINCFDSSFNILEWAKKETLDLWSKGLISRKPYEEIRRIHLIMFGKQHYR